MQPVKKDVSSVERERDYWYREAIVAQEMLAQVLVTIGKTVEVPKGRPLPEGVGILVNIDEDRQVVAFELAQVDDEGNKVGEWEPQP